MKNSTKIVMILIFFMVSDCTQKVVKPPLPYKEGPVEPLVVKIIKTEKEQKRERLKERAYEIVKKLPLSIKCGQMIMSYPPSYDTVREYQIGGIILNQNFIKDVSTTIKMVEEYNKQTLIPLFFAIDQEGGLVNRLKHIDGFEKTPSAMELGNSFSDRELLEYGYNTGITMRKLGLNMNLAPSLDLSGKENALMHKQKRSLGDNPFKVKRKGESLIDGYRAGGILCFAKHYPGYSNVEINSDVTVAHFTSSPIEMAENFTLFISLSHKIDGVIMSSVIYSFLDSLPALFSKNIIDLLRITNPDILVMTDDLYAPALRILDKENLSIISTKAFMAGNDILLIMWDIKTPVLIEAIQNSIKVNQQLQRQVDNSVVRILLAKEKVYPGLIDKLFKKWVKKEQTR